MRCRRRNIVVAAAFLLAATALYAIWIEPRRLTITHVVIQGGGLAGVLSGRTVAFLGDLHFGAAGEPVAAAVLNRLESIRPDLILLGGDYVDWGSRGAAYDRAFDFLSRLRAPLGVYGILGDADTTFSRKSCEFCHEPGSGLPTRRPGAVMLRDEARTIATERGAFRLVGLDARRQLPPAAVAGLLGGDDPAIVIAHSSLIYGQIGADRDTLVLSGDTHGGQILLPTWFWRLTRLKPDPEHIHGLFRDGEKSLFVTRGVGTSHVPFRLGAPPEIVLLAFEAPSQP